jgi:hypothetical protein
MARTLFSDEKKFNLDGSGGNIFLKGLLGAGLWWSGRLSVMAVNYQLFF